MTNLLINFLTDWGRKSQISRTREILSSLNREMTMMVYHQKALVSESFFDSNLTFGGLGLINNDDTKPKPICQVNVNWVWTGGELNPRDWNDKSYLLTRVRPTEFSISSIKI